MPVVESLNHSLFLWIQASATPPAGLLALARFLAEDLVWGLPLLFVLLWLRADAGWRRALLDAALSAAVALGIGAIIGILWPQPRPFALGLGHRFIAHAADASFPSDHLSLIWAVAASWWLGARQRRAAQLLGLAGFAVAWARVYAGVHFPADMLGAMGVAWAGAAAVRQARKALNPLHARIETLRCRLLARAISSGLARA